MDRHRQQVVEIVEVLHADGFVASQVAVDYLDAFGIGPLSQHHAGRVAGQDIEEEEDQRDHPEQDEDAVEKPFQSVAQHFFKLKIES